MTEQEARNLFLDYLYEEMDEEQKQEFEQFLTEHPGLEEELRELSETRQLLQKVPLQTPAHKLVMVDPGAVTDGEIKHPPPSHFSKGDFPGVSKRRIYNPAFMKSLFAIAAVLLAVVMAFSFVNLQIGQTEEGFYLALGKVPAPPEEPQGQIPEVQAEHGIGEAEVLNLIDQIRRENTLLMGSMMEQMQDQQTARLEEARNQQNAQLEEALNVLTAYYEQQRQQDLILIAEGLSQLEEDTYYRFLRTDEALGDIIYALNNP